MSKEWWIEHGGLYGCRWFTLDQEQIDIARVLALYPELEPHFARKETTSMKTIRHERGCLHVETPLGIVNIRVGLTDRKGRSVDSIAVSPGALAGEPKIVLYGRHNTRLVRLKGGRR